MNWIPQARQDLQPKIIEPTQYQPLERYTSGSLDKVAIGSNCRLRAGMWVSAPSAGMGMQVVGEDVWLSATPSFETTTNCLLITEAVGVPPYSFTTGSIAKREDTTLRYPKVGNMATQWCGDPASGLFGFEQFLQTLTDPPLQLREVLEDYGVGMVEILRGFGARQSGRDSGIAGPSLDAICATMLQSTELKYRVRFSERLYQPYGGVQVHVLSYPPKIMEAIRRVARTGWMPLLPFWAGIHGSIFSRGWDNPCGPTNMWWTQRESEGSPEDGPESPPQNIPMGEVDRKLTHGVVAGFSLDAPGAPNSYQGYMDPLWEDAFVEECALLETPPEEPQGPWLLEACAHLPIILTPVRLPGSAQAEAKKPRFYKIHREKRGYAWYLRLDQWGKFSPISTRIGENNEEVS